MSTKSNTIAMLSEGSEEHTVQRLAEIEETANGEGSYVRSGGIPAEELMGDIDERESEEICKKIDEDIGTTHSLDQNSETDDRKLKEVDGIYRSFKYVAPFVDDINVIVECLRQVDNDEDAEGIATMTYFKRKKLYKYIEYPFRMPSSCHPLFMVAEVPAEEAAVIELRVPFTKCFAVEEWIADVISEYEYESANGCSPLKNGGSETFASE